MKIETVIFSWPGQEINTRNLQNKIHNLGFYVRVIHSGTPPLDVSWHGIPEDSFYGQQMQELIKTTAKGVDIVVLIQSDAVPEDLNKFFQSIIRAFTNKAIGVWTGKIDYSFWTIENSTIKCDEIVFDSGDQDLVLTSNSDMTAWAIRIEVLREFESLGIPVPKLGYGIDLVICSLARRLDLYVVRDKSVSILHKKGSGYDERKALEEMRSYIQRLPRGVIIDVMRTFQLTKFEQNNE